MDSAHQSQSPTLVIIMFVFSVSTDLEEVEFWIGVIGFKFISPRDQIINCFQIMKTSYINEYNRYINIQNITVQFNPLFTFQTPPFH